MSRRAFFRLIWIVLIGAPVAVEIGGFFSTGDWDMLSEHVIPFLMSHPAIWWSTLIAYVIGTIVLLWHWWFQYRNRFKR